MTTVMSDRLAGVAGNTFAGDAVYSGLLGTAPTFAADARYGVGLQFAAAVMGSMDETFTGTTQRVFDRIYLISGAVSIACAIGETRTGANTCKWIIDAAGKLQLQNAAGTTLTGGVSAAALPVGTRFRLAVNMNGTALTAVIYNNDTDNTIRQTLTPSGTIVSASPTICREGMLTATGLGAGVTLTMFWPEDGATAETGVRSLWEPGHNPQTVRRRTFSLWVPRRPGTIAAPTYAQASPPTAVEPDPKRLPNLHRRRFVSTVPAQVAVAPPFVPAPVRPKRAGTGSKRGRSTSAATYAQASPPTAVQPDPKRPMFLRRGRHVAVTPAQQNPPRAPAAGRVTTGRDPGQRRGKSAQVVPAQNNPPKLPTVWSARGKAPGQRRGKSSSPTPQQQAVIVGSWPPPNLLDRARTLVLGRRGKSSTPVQAQQTAPSPARVPTAGALSRVRSLAATRRGRTVTPTPAQQNPPLTPAQVQPKRIREITARLRGRIAVVVPAQQNPPTVPSVVRPRIVRGIAARKSRVTPRVVEQAGTPAQARPAARFRPVGRRGRAVTAATGQPPIPPKYPTRPPRPPRFIAARTRYKRITNWIQTLAQPAPPGATVYTSQPATSKWRVGTPVPHFLARPATPRWAVSTPIPHFLAGVPTSRWKVSVPFTWRQPVTATLQIPVPIEQLVHGVPANVTLFPVGFAFQPTINTEPVTYLPGTWDTSQALGPQTPYQALTPLIGPANGGQNLGRGTWYVWMQITTGTEVWVAEVGTLIIG